MKTKYAIVNRAYVKGNIIRAPRSIIRPKLLVAMEAVGGDGSPDGSSPSDSGRSSRVNSKHGLALGLKTKASFVDA